jgi:hypothetical protein
MSWWPLLILRNLAHRTTTCSMDRETFESRNFSFEPEVICAEETWLNGQYSEFFWVACKSYRNGLRIVLGRMGCMLNKFRVCTLQLVSLLGGLSTYQHILVEWSASKWNITHVTSTKCLRQAYVFAETKFGSKFNFDDKTCWWSTSVSLTRPDSGPG